MSRQSCRQILLARGLVIVYHKILVAHFRDEPYVFLPGGHIECGEAAVAALRREFHEELGATALVRKYLGAIEHQFPHENELIHEINHVFHVDIPSLNGDVVPDSLERDLDFAWHPLESIIEIDLRPPPLRELVQRFSEGDCGVWWESTL